jgi:hypothetical protein
MNLPVWPDAQPWENYLFAVVAIVLVLLNRKSMLHRGEAATEILAPAKVRVHAPVAAPSR